MPSTPFHSDTRRKQRFQCGTPGHTKRGEHVVLKHHKKNVGMVSCGTGSLFDVNFPHAACNMEFKTRHQFMPYSNKHEATHEAHQAQVSQMFHPHTSHTKSRSLTRACSGRSPIQKNSLVECHISPDQSSTTSASESSLATHWIHGISSQRVRSIP